MFFKEEKNSGKCIQVNMPVLCTAECLGISTKTVKRVTKKRKEGGEYPEIDKRNRDMVISDESISLVCETIFSLYREKVLVTLNSVLGKLQAKIQTRNSGWKWSRSTLYRMLTKKMNYTYSTKKSYYESLKEDVAIGEQRMNYLQQVKEFRKQGKTIFYQDETWINKNMTPLKTWLDPDREIAPIMPQGKGERSIISHVGSEHGFLAEAQLIYRGNKALKNSDYHSEMNSTVFLDYMETKVLPALPPNSVLVLDRATYHMKLTDAIKPASF